MKRSTLIACQLLVKSTSVQADHYQRIEVPEPYDNIIYHPDSFWNRPHSTWADSGDSGGPVLRNGKVIAILSTRHEKCETLYGEDYAIMNTATRVQKLIHPTAK